MRNLVLNDKGSITLEATIVFPIFLAFMLLLINFINMAYIYLAMDHAVSETTKEIATHAYPLKYLKVTQEKKENKIDLEDIDFRDLQGSLTKMALNFVQNVGENLVIDIGNNLANKGTDLALKATKGLIEKMLVGYLPDDLKAKVGNKIIIQEFEMYNPNNTSGSNGTLHDIPLNNEDIAITVKYNVKLPVPFVPVREITLSNTAVERAWVD